MSVVRPNTIVAGVVLVLAIAAAAAAQPANPGDRKVAATVPARLDPAREEAALGFVREHQPELATLLESLKPMRPGEYDTAIRQLDQVRQSLHTLRAANPERYGLGLKAWQARTRVELLAAKLASSPGPRSELESELRQAVAAQLEAEIRVQRFEHDQAEARAKRLAENLRRLEADRDGVVDARLRALLRKTRRLAGTARGATAPKPKQTPKPTPTPTADPNKGERPR